MPQRRRTSARWLTYAYPRPSSGGCARMYRCRDPVALLAEIRAALDVASGSASTVL